MSGGTSQRTAWTDEASELERKLRNRLFTAFEFDGLLSGLLRHRGSPVTAVFGEFQSSDPPLEVTVGQRGVGNAHAVDTWPQTESGPFTVKEELWYADGANPDHELGREAVHRLLSAWWQGNGRNEKSRLLTGQSPPTQRALEESLRQWSLNGVVALCAADIDNFKQFNDMKGYPAGDALIGRLAAALVAASPRHSLVIHRSGDEFVVVFPNAQPGEVVADMMDIREQIESQIRQDVDLDPPPGLSIGVALCAEPMAYTALEDLAGTALKPGGAKRRGSVVVAPLAPAPVPDAVDPVALQLVLAMNLLDRPEPFSDPWLDAASVVAFRACAAANDLADLQGTLRGALARFAEVDSGLPSKRAIIAAAHGLTRAFVTGHGPGELSGIAVHVAEDLVVTDQASGSVIVGESVPAGARTICIVGSEPDMGGVDSRRAILVTIGDTNFGLPSDLFAAKVLVDDRPTLGGGLPDMWEAALAQVIVSANRHPNADRVFLAGRLDMGVQTVERLRNAANWSAPEQAEWLAAKLGLPQTNITKAGSRIADRVVDVVSAADVITVMVKDLEDSGPLRPPSEADPVPEPPRLRRTLSMDGMLPGKEYGCRVATASDAFPVALDIVRQIQDGPLEDQTGRLFRELVDFRIQLSQPRTDPIPRFYRAESNFLQKYFAREFLDQDGLFRSRLNEHGQMDAVLAHVANVIATGRLTSRRALLVVPHVPDGDLSPLGLVSVRIIPRPSSPRTVRLDYSFTWRTVEALVGLPYSLYGSIRFSEHITELVTTRLGAADPSVSMGELSYIAHSLHMFVDEYADQVARRIVNDDSA